MTALDTIDEIQRKVLRENLVLRLQLGLVEGYLAGRKMYGDRITLDSIAQAALTASRALEASKETDNAV